MAQYRQHQLGTLPADNLRHVLVQQGRQGLQHARFILPGWEVQNHFLTDVQHGMNADHAMQVIGQEFIRPAGPAALQGKVDDVCIADVGIQLVQGTDAIDIGQGLDIQGE
jgi:hypothetical protein